MRLSSEEIEKLSFLYLDKKFDSLNIQSISDLCDEYDKIKDSITKLQPEKKLKTLSKNQLGL